MTGSEGSVIVREDFRDTEDLDGLFSSPETWAYAEERDETLQHPRCVFQVLKRHFARYTPEMVEQACGIPRDRFLEVADVFTAASGREKTGAICYAVGWTQHSTGVQTIRAAAILQLLLGNMGRPMALNLVKRGFALVVNDVDPAKVEPLRAAGAKVAATAADVAAATERTIVIVETTKQVIYVSNVIRAANP